MLARRSLLRIPRQPDLLVGFTIQPIMFVLLFVYVFGGAIQTPGYDYVDFLIPGILVQSHGLRRLRDRARHRRGRQERPDRPLPGAADEHAPPCSPAGRLPTSARTPSNLPSCSGSGLPVGFSFRRRVGEISPGIVLLLLIGFAFSWVFAFIGLVASSPEAANAYGFTDPLPTDLHLLGVRPGRFDARLAPMVRGAQPDHGDRSTRPRVLFLDAQADNAVWLSFVWVLVIAPVFGTLSVWRFRRALSR